MKMIPIELCPSEFHAVKHGGVREFLREIDFNDVFDQTGCRSGNLAFSTFLNNWAVFGGETATLAEVNCPFGKTGDRLDVCQGRMFAEVEKVQIRDGKWRVKFRLMEGQKHNQMSEEMPCFMLG